MPGFGARSLAQLQTCHPQLITLFAAVVEVHDCTILEGHRSAARQSELVAKGASKTHDSRHFALPSLAVDVAPYPIEWPDQMLPSASTEVMRRKAWGRWYLFAGVVFATAHRLSIPVRWGGAWAGGMDPRGNRFDDLVHWELAP